MVPLGAKARSPKGYDITRISANKSNEKPETKKAYLKDEYLAYRHLMMVKSEMIRQSKLEWICNSLFQMELFRDRFVT